jgi:hypothetical protein
LKRKRECIDFGPCANPPFKSRKTYSSKASTKHTKSILDRSKILSKNLAKPVPKPPYSLPLGVAVVSNGLSELIEGDYFTDDEVNKIIVIYVLDVFKCPDGYMSSQIYKEVIKLPGWSFPIAILCAIVFTIIINSYWPMLISMIRYLKKILQTVDIARGVEKFQDNQKRGVELINMLSKQPPGPKPAASSDSTAFQRNLILIIVYGAGQLCVFFMAF